ncbi:DUF2513 domain-containing protein [Ascidiaceihabitans sp.]|uniref:DUF2513 domain-containing protein n=1 Tax=Ascidiaceihabitans sp. TaxID=1872644 RepID=UPI0032974ADE
MKRDDDLIRDLLFRIEAEGDHLSMDFTVTLGMSAEKRREVGHIRLLADAGFVALSGKSGDVVRITNDGHNFIAAIRDDTTWAKTKEVTSKAGVSILTVMFDVAVGLGKEKLTEITGLKL